MKRNAPSPIVTSPSPTNGEDGQEHKKQKLMAETVSGEAKNELTRVQKRKEKKASKVVAKIEANPPKFFYSASELSKRRDPVGIEDMRDMILHLTADAPPPSWLKVENPSHISKVVAILIPGLTLPLLDIPVPSKSSNPNMPSGVPPSVPKLPFLSRFMHACPTRAPGDRNRMHSVMSAFVSVPVSGEEKKRRMEERIRQEQTTQGDPSMYTLSLNQMIDDEYPIPSYMLPINSEARSLPEGWIEVPNVPPSRKLGGRKKPPKVYALDCEMCITATSTRALTHISIISYDTNETIYDTLVKPPDPITDYLTRFSGVTEERLRNVSTTLEDVQVFLTKLLLPPLPPSSPAWEPSFPTISSPPPKRKPKHGPNGNDGEDDEFETPILLGHSLNSDLQALKLRHPRCIDTSVIFHHPRGVPYKPGLAWLTRKWLGREIQAAGGMGVVGLEGGHDPEEDARACVDLLRKKIENGPGFGEFKTDLESIFERIARAPPNPALSSSAQMNRRRSVVVDHGNPANWYGKKAEKSIACESDEEVLRGVLGALGAEEGGGKAAEGAGEGARKEEEYSFVFARFTELADGLGWITPKTLSSELDSPEKQLAAPVLSAGQSQPETQPHPQSRSPTKETDIPTILVSLNTRLQAIYSALPARAALFIFTGHDDPRAMAELNRRRTKFEAGYRVSQLGVSASAAVSSSSTGNGRSKSKSNGFGAVGSYLTSGVFFGATSASGGENGDGSGKILDPETGEEVRWTSEDARKLEEETEKAKRGLMFLCIKK